MRSADGRELVLQAANQAELHRVWGALRAAMNVLPERRNEEVHAERSEAKRRLAAMRSSSRSRLSAEA